MNCKVNGLKLRGEKDRATGVFSASTRADREQSGTARENLAGSGAFDVLDELPDTQKRLVDFAVPGLRAILGYE